MSGKSGGKVVYGDRRNGQLIRTGCSQFVGTCRVESTGQMDRRRFGTADPRTALNEYKDWCDGVRERDMDKRARACGYKADRIEAEAERPAAPCMPFSVPKGNTALVLATLMRHVGDDSRVLMTYGAIAEETGLTRKQIERALRSLRGRRIQDFGGGGSVNLLELISAGKRWRPSIYKLNLDSQWAEAVQKAADEAKRATATAAKRESETGTKSDQGGMTMAVTKNEGGQPKLYALLVVGGAPLYVFDNEDKAFAVHDALTAAAKASGFAAKYDVVEVERWVE